MASWQQKVSLLGNYEHAYQFCHGFHNCSVTVRESNFGTLNQWLNSWIPANDHEVGIILEDDLEVSKRVFAFCLACYCLLFCATTAISILLPLY